MIYQGDCLQIMPTLDANSIDTIITDPPYGLSFMGKEWDHGIPGVPFWEAALRVAKPGAMLLAFGGTRTHHRLMSAIEDAGWEIRDCLMWLYGSGFPKSMDISKAIDKAAGAKTDAAKEWDGWGTALKPAWEPIILAMKPLDGTFVQNAQEHGVAGLNIDGCRIGDEVVTTHSRGNNGAFPKRPGEKTVEESGRKTDQRNIEAKPREGRWPANVILDEEAGAILDEQSGYQKDGVAVSRNKKTGESSGNKVYGKRNVDLKDVTYGGGGGASRFFYCAKASKSEKGDFNNHPTVKPLKLMEYLCRLTATPTGGTVLDPFMGSGSTGLACKNTGREFIGIELNQEYFNIAARRLGVAA